MFIGFEKVFEYFGRFFKVLEDSLISISFIEELEIKECSRRFQ